MLATQAATNSYSAGKALVGATEKWLDFVFLLVEELAFHFGFSVAETFRRLTPCPHKAFRHTNWQALGFNSVALVPTASKQENWKGLFL
jgi:hypothetical protein